VLERGHDARLLEPADVCGADDPDEVRVLPERLLDAAPAVVAHHVEDRRETLVDADRVHALADRARHPLDERGVEGRAPRQRGREDGGLEGGEAGQALVVRDGGDPEPRPLDDVLLHPREPPRALDRIDRLRSERPGQVPEPVGAGLLERERIAERLLQRRHVARAQVRPDPRAAELGELLVGGHLGEQRFHALGDGQGGVGPGLWHGDGSSHGGPAGVKPRSAIRDRRVLSGRVSPEDARLVVSPGSSIRRRAAALAAAGRDRRRRRGAPLAALDPAGYRQPLWHRVAAPIRIQPPPGRRRRWQRCSGASPLSSWERS
jgi:hypothetical protein